jgi:hypothetical protein
MRSCHVEGESKEDMKKKFEISSGRTSLGEFKPVEVV